jgi:D-arabinose 1-dehydrogenase-like Zn-dependent alcohol dehydrogenase
MIDHLPERGRVLAVTCASDGAIGLAITEKPVDRPGPAEVVVRVEAAPIHPSDVALLVGPGDPASAGTVPGLVGAGTVIATGALAERLIGRRVAVLAPQRGTFAEYVTVASAGCVLLPLGVSSHAGADVFCNPMAALAIAETARGLGQAALILTAAASNLGRMLLRVCQQDGLTLIAVVRRAEQVAVLSALGVDHVCNSADPDFARQLRAAIAATGAALAFDAIGGGTTPAILLEALAAGQAPAHARRVFVHGQLDASPIALDPTRYGTSWALRQWALPQVLDRLGPERVARMRQRVLSGIETTFASTFAREVSLSEACDPTTLSACARMATGTKLLINPML